MKGPIKDNPLYLLIFEKGVLNPFQFCLDILNIPINPERQNFFQEFIAFLDGGGVVVGETVIENLPKICFHVVSWWGGGSFLIWYL